MNTKTVYLGLMALGIACNKDASLDDTATGSSASFIEIAEGALWSSDMTVSISGETLTLQSNGLPNHAYDDVYAGLDQTGTVEQSVQEVDYSYEISLAPVVASAISDTSMGSIGPATSGAVYFNPYDATGEYAYEVQVESDYKFIDDCNGHPTPNDGQYHYHGVPLCISAAVDSAGEHSHVVGFLFDGFPIYGPQGEDGEAPTDLDECMGHVGPVPETSGSVYHYHTSLSAPYISECYRGTPQVSGGGGPP